MREFIKQVSKNCPMNPKILKTEVEMAKGDKELAFQAIDKARRTAI